jgi:hypothetical protein
MWDDEVKDSGFSIISGILSHDEITGLLCSLDKAHLPRSRAGIRHALRHPAIAELANMPRLIDIARSDLGGTASPFRATLFDKSPASNWLVVWHQDTALPLRERHEVSGWGPWSQKDGVTYAHAPAEALSSVLALRLHLDDSTKQNGPLRVLPGTHLLGVLADDAIHRIATQISAVECTVTMGGVLAMRPLLIHSSSKSVGKTPRRILHIEYAASLNLEDGLELAIA